MRLYSTYTIECEGIKRPPPDNLPGPGVVPWFNLFPGKQEAPKRCGHRFESHGKVGSCPACGSGFEIQTLQPAPTAIEEEAADTRSMFLEGPELASAHENKIRTEVCQTCAGGGRLFHEFGVLASNYHCPDCAGTGRRKV